MREVACKLGKHMLHLQLEPRTVILCDNEEEAQRTAAALQAAGGTLIDGREVARGTVAEQLPKRTGEDLVTRIRGALRLHEDVLSWRPRDSGPLPRMVASTLLALVREEDLLIFDFSALSGSPFDVAHACAHMRRVAMEFPVTVIGVIADPALISSAGAHLVVISQGQLVEAGSVTSTLADPRSEALLHRLEATPIPSPLAMQMRRVQRVATAAVNYAHTTIIQLPTQESIALAGGDE
ncbi:MAG: hypothetical protein ACYC3W_03375 [Candidatus Nanopelagicales bacterium]